MPLAAAAWLLHGSCAAPLATFPLARVDAPLLVDEHLELARRYAPWILNEVDRDPERGRQDLPTRADFDGNLRGDDNWERFDHFELPPVVYYAVVGSETHWFLTYHLFHPRDWTPFDLGLHLTHENDGENLQVVVERRSGRVVLLLAQAHYDGRAFANPGSGFADGDEPIRGPLILVDGDGRIDPQGEHAVVTVERCGHGIHGLADEAIDVEFASDGRARFGEAGLVLRPARKDESVAEPRLDAGDDASVGAGSPVPYALASTVASFWPGLRDGWLVGEDGLFDGSLELVTPELTIGVPRYYESNRFSGPFGDDRGISPFAVDFEFGEGEVGALLFDPARRYSACLEVPDPWSLRYVEFPFATTR